MKLTRTNLWGISRAGRANFQEDSEAKLGVGRVEGDSQSTRGEVMLCLFEDGWVPGHRATLVAPDVRQACGDGGPQGSDRNGSGAALSTRRGVGSGGESEL